MSDQHPIGGEETRMLLGRLLAYNESATAERKRLEETIREGFSEVHRRIDELVPLPAKVAAHEAKVDERHRDNIAKFDELSKDLKELKEGRASDMGARRIVKWLIGLLVGGGGLLALFKGWFHG